MILDESGNKHESSTRRNFKIIKTDSIKEILSLEKPNPQVYFPFSDLNQPLPNINIKKLEEREEIALKQRELQLNTKVTTKGQLIFDAISKLVPCHWEKDKIIIMDSIVLVHPYKPENASGDNLNSLQRVQKIIEGEWKKMNKK